MSDFNTIAQAVQLLSTLANTGVNIYNAARPGPTPGAPGAPPMPPTRAGAPVNRANTAANVGGGISPEFLASLVSDEGGSPQGAIDILAEMRRGMNPQV